MKQASNKMRVGAGARGGLPASRPANETRFDMQYPAGKFKGGKLAPMSFTVLREREAGIYNFQAAFELAPIAGRLMTPITCGMVSVYVPAPAIDALKNPEQDYAGSSDVFRAKLLGSTVIFDFENETEISRRVRCVPRSISGVKKVGEHVRLAHNVAVNYLRQRLYHKAELLDKDHDQMTPALLSRTVLDRFNAVLDPEDRINGKIDFTGSIPVRGLALGTPGLSGVQSMTGVKSDGDGSVDSMTGRLSDLTLMETDGSGAPQVFADLAGADGVSLQDFYSAERMDKITRQIGTLIKDNPTYGEEIALRWARGLSADIGQQPFVLYEKEWKMGEDTRRATDGASLDVIVTDTMDRGGFAVPVPATEFGGVIITFGYVKPDETLANQPHPYGSDVWTAQNFIVDEMALDPVPVTARELDAECDPSDEGNVVFYTGNNGLKRSYVSYGWNRELDTSTVEAQTALWQYEVPLSVTPDNILYPDDLGQYPFADQYAEICTYVGKSTLTVSTPTIFGPLPVEEVDIIEDADIFGDAES